MSSTIKTENLKLSQFQNADVPSWRTDYNSDMNKIDSAYAKSISGQDEENDIQNGDYLGFYDVSAEKNKKTLWSNIIEKLGSVFSKNSQILSTVEECEASTENNNIAGASAIAELNSSLQNLMGAWVHSGLTTNLTVLQTGIYCINNYDGKITDAPFGGVFGIIVSKVDNNFVFQLAFGMDGIKHRQCEIGNWSEWE